MSGSKFARYAAEIMATEAVHRALALQSLGKLGNDRVYAKFAQREEVTGLPTTGSAASTRSWTPSRPRVGRLRLRQGRQQARPMYSYDEVSARTPTDPDVNTITIS